MRLGEISCGLKMALILRHRCYEDAYASGCLAGIELGKTEAEAKLKELRGGENANSESKD